MLVGTYGGVIQRHLHQVRRSKGIKEDVRLCSGLQVIIMKHGRHKIQLEVEYRTVLLESLTYEQNV
jgi:hypothetical protein